jgi:acetolactate synthase-1/2/3 large subunit
MKKTGGQSVVEVLRREGVQKVFGVPGESYLYVLDAFFDHSDIDYISARQEGGASFMAEGYAKSSGNVGVCMATRGPGATNLSIGIHTAQQDSTPLVALIGQVERSAKDREAFQEIDYVPFFSHLCKWTVEINQADRIPELLHRAFHIARSGRPGPVLVSLPEDMLQEFTEVEGYMPYHVNPIQPSEASIRLAAEELATAEKPIIIAGGGVTQSHAQQELIQIAETLQIPVITAFRRFTAFPNSHANYAGSLGMGAPSYLLDYIQDSDLILALGTRFSQLTTNNYTLLHKNTRLIHVDISPDTIGKVYTPSLPIVSDVKAFAQGLLKVIKPVENPQRVKNLADVTGQYNAFSSSKQDYCEEYVDMDGMMHDLIQQLPKDAIITNDAGNFFTWLSRYYRFDLADTYVGPTSGAMGYGLPAAIGAKIAHPDRVVVSFSGDGGFMMTMQEFDTAVRYNIPTLSIVVNNSMFGTIRSHQEREFPGRVVGTQLSNHNFAQMAENFGGHGERIEKNEDFIPALERALAAGKPALIEVLTDPAILSANQKKATQKEVPIRQ